MFDTKYHHELKTVSTVIDSWGGMLLSLNSTEDVSDTARPGACHRLVVHDGDTDVEISKYRSVYPTACGDNLSALLTAHASELTYKATLWKRSGILKGWSR